MNMAKISIFVQSRSSPPRRRELRLHEELCLGEPEAPNFPVSTTPRHGLLCLVVGPSLGEGPLRLGEPEVLFFSHFFR